MMFRMAGVLFVVLVFSCSTLEESLPIHSAFPYPCSGPNKDKNLSKTDILKVRRAHEKWLKDSKNPAGHKANFCGAGLSQGKFQEAALKSADFQMAMLAGANFTGAMLNKAQLQGANLSGANFSQADLTEAKLDHAMLHLATFRKTNLHRASLRHAMLYKANLQGIDLTDVEGLTQSQINMACLDGDTKLHKDLNRPEPCSQKTRH
jgi:uncharacterized protein YjbI with pentapeptide repeats